MRRGVGRGRPLRPCHAGVMPAAIGTDTPVFHALRLRSHAHHPNLVRARLFLARWIRLPRRHMGSRGRVGPDRLRHPRGLRGAAEAQEPSEQMSAMLLMKHRQDGFVRHGNMYVHAASHSVRVLTVGSDETASTPKIVSDAASADRSIKTMRPPLAASSRELAFRLLYIRRPGAGVRRLFTPGRKVGGLVEKACGDIRIRGGHCKLEKGCRLFR
jgi:hypothetical protein